MDAPQGHGLAAVALAKTLRRARFTLLGSASIATPPENHPVCMA
jgi:hypothetical protein